MSALSLPPRRADRRRTARAVTVVAVAGALLSGCATKRVPLGYAPPPGYTSVGVASWYGPGFHGRRTSNGERFDQEALTAAHRLWAFGTLIRVTHLRNGKSVIVRVNDRIPRKDRVLDLSKGAARAIGLIGPGTGRVRLEVLGREVAAPRRLRSGVRAVARSSPAPRPPLAKAPRMASNGRHARGE